VGVLEFANVLFQAMRPTGRARDHISPTVNSS
jgi:hypothetical protein